jgi:hypothetical protein
MDRRVSRIDDVTGVDGDATSEAQAFAVGEASAYRQSNAEFRESHSSITPGQ